MPELPEVQALVTDLRGRLLGRTVDRLVLVSFAALKTFDPPATALQGATVTAVDRHGKYLDLCLSGPAIGDVHMLVHLARAGWLRWRDSAPSPVRPGGKGPLAARLVLDDGSGFDLTEAGTKKSLAIHLVRDPQDVERVATLGPDPLDPGFTVDVLAGILAARDPDRHRDHPHHQNGDEQQLPETLARILRVGQPLSDLHVLISPEQHRDLHAHKGDEQQIQGGQRQAPLPARQLLGLRRRQPIKARRLRQHVDGGQREPADRDRLSIRFGDMVLAENGWRAPSYDEAATSAYMKGDSLVIGVDLGLGKGARTVWTCDLTHGYIDINADYRS